MQLSPRLLVISHDIVGKAMAGPGIRYYQLARTLSQYLPTTLAVPGLTDLEPPTSQLDIKNYERRNWPSLSQQVARSTICLVPGDIVSEFPQLATAPVFIIIDGYNPLLPEGLATLDLSQFEQAQGWWQQRMLDLAPQCLVGDFFLCASDRQRDWWIGVLETHGRINPATYRADPSLRNLIDIVPYGLDLTLPKQGERVVKGVWPSIESEDRLLVWGGGLWPWLDALTAIRAVAKVRTSRSDVKLIFPGVQHPNPAMGGLRTQLDEARALAQELNLLDQGVYFGDWVPYDKWSAILLESDIALSLHHDTLETRFAFRSRLFESIRAGLPSVVTTGDATSEIVQQYGLGCVVDYGDVDGVAVSIQKLLQEPANDRLANFAIARQKFQWDSVAVPLIRFCLNPHLAADRSARGFAPGNPYYSQRDQSKREKLQTELEYWQRLAHGYANGRVMRLLNRLSRFMQKVGQ